MSGADHIDLNQLRIEITELDEALLKLLARRREITLNVAKSKIQDKRPVRDVKREQLLMENLAKKGKPLNLEENYINQVYRAIVEDSVAQQIKYIAEHSDPAHHKDKVSVAFLGGKGTYSHIATNTYFAKRYGSTDAIKEVAKQSFDDIFKAVQLGEAEFAMLPVENTSSGSINEVYDLLQRYAEDVHIVGEQTIAVRHNLLVKQETELSKIKTIYGHFQPIAQCSDYLSELPSGIHIEAMKSTAQAMEKAVELNDPSVAVIGSEQGGHFYGLSSLVNQIANQKEANETRFVIISKHKLEVPQQSLAKTSLIFSVHQQPGALVKPLLTFSEYGIDLCKLESRPITGKPGEEMFYVDVLANATDAQYQKALGHIINERMATSIVTLGSYERESLT